MSKKMKRLAKSRCSSRRLTWRGASAQSTFSSSMFAIMQRIRLMRLLHSARRRRLTAQLLELLIEQHPVEADVVGIGAGAYAGIPEGWLFRDRAGAVRMVVIGG